MPITKTATENIPDNIWGLYQALLEIAFGNENPSRVPQFYTKDAFMIGTAEKELVIGHQALIDFYDTQQKASSEVNLSYRRFPVKSWHPTKETFCITDEYDMILENEVAFRMRLTCIFIKQGKKWLCDHIHSSVPDRNVPEDEFWPIEELKRQNQILEEKVKERTRELEIEAATEKVRAQAMGMLKPDDMMSVLTTLRKCLTELSLEYIAVVVLIDNEDGSMTQWDITEMTSGEQNLFKIHIDLKKAPLIAESYKKVKKISYGAFEFKGAELQQLANELKTLDKKNGEVFQKAIDDGFLKSFYPIVKRFAHGLLEIDFKAKPPEGIEAIATKMSLAIEQAYTRFLDLQKAEAQAREAQVEAALERVRARTMAMQHSDELSEASFLLDQEVRALGIKTWGCAFNIYREKDSIEWFGNEKGVLPTYTIPRKGIFKKYYDLGHKGSSIHVQEFKGEKCIAHYEYMSTLPVIGEVLRELKKTNGSFPEYQIDHVVYFKYGYLLFITVEQVPEAHEIFKRFAKVFEQTYTRFLDLKKAEAQAKETKIELALERIRAQATAMKSSSDLQDIVVTMRKEFVALDYEAHYFWHMRWLPDCYEKAMTAGDGARIGMVMKLPRHIHGDIPLVAKWEKGKSPTLVFPMDAETAVTYVDKMITLGDFEQLDPNAPSLEDVRNLGGLTFIMARTTHGEIGYSLPGNIPNPSNEGIETLRRFAGAFDLAYRRFEDLKQAEHQAREAQIEAAVERVRSEAMAMHQPSDLVKVTQTLIKEITNLGIEGITGAAFILIDENDIVTMWDISDPGNMGYTRDHKSTYDPKEFNMLGEFWRKWKQGEEYFVIEYDLEKNKKELEEWKLVDEENYQSLKRAIESNKLKTQWNPFGSFSSGLLTLDMMTEPDKDTENIVVKMAKTFDLAYQRFDDLQKAAEQAKEARKQASLDRIRAEIASMRNQSDMEKLTPFIWMELSTLGISFFRCGIFIMDERSRKINMYLSTPVGESIAAMVLDFDNSPITKTASEHWMNQQIFREKWSKEDFISWSEDLADQGLVDSPSTYQHDALPPEKLCLQFVPFKQGMLYIGTEDFLKEKDLDLIQDVADTFSIAYTRYEDFVQLEKAKRMAEDALGELRSTQSQLIHAEKMASLGELTAGIAHEIQNPLNFVNNFSDLNAELIDELTEAMKAGDADEAAEILNDLKENEQKIIHHGRRAEGIVKGMLQHSRGGDGKKELTDINNLADEFLRLSYHGLRAKDKTFNAEFKCTLDTSLPKIKVLSQDIGRVFLNLINNAFHATAERSKNDTAYKPVVEVVTEKVDDHIQILIKDNGAGIPDKIKDKIFQPFFTTKATGTGTGLGLSLSHDIISKGHGGTISLDSEVGKGTTFTIRLPIHAS